MMSWMAERDRLLAQTRAFVKEVAAAHPKPAQDLPPDALPSGAPRSDAGVVTVNAAAARIPAASKTSEALKNLEALPHPPSVAIAPARPIPQDPIVAEANVPTGWASIGGGGESDRALNNASDNARPTVAAPSSDTILTIPRVATSERDDIAIRVAHFREHQRRLNREREAYSEQMRARMRSLIGNGGSAA